MSAFFKVWDVQVAHLQKQLQASEQHAVTQQLTRDFDEKGASSWHFAKDDIGFMCAAYYRPRYSAVFE